MHPDSGSAHATCLRPKSPASRYGPPNPKFAGVKYKRLPLELAGAVVTHACAYTPSQAPLPAAARACESQVDGVQLFVCCHGSRDVRCGLLGPPLARRLLALAKERGLGDRVKVYSTSHVGGHKVSMGA